MHRDLASLPSPDARRRTVYREIAAAREGAACQERQAWPRAIARLLTPVLLAVLIASLCACAPKKPTYKKLPPAQKAPTEAPAKQAPPEGVRTNATPSTADQLTPKRQASMRLVERGQNLFAAQDYERAAATLRDAINVDASNGVAYYHLAAVDAKLGQTDLALGLLDKAEALLGADAEWMTRISNLRTELGAAGASPTGPSPVDKAF